jgi:hypothetical protein
MKDYARYTDGERTIVMLYEEGDKDSFHGLSKVWVRIGNIVRNADRKPFINDSRWQ